MCCFNGNEGCLQGGQYCDSSMCDVFEDVKRGRYLLPSLSFPVASPGIRVSGLQSACGFLLTALAYITKGQKAARGSSVRIGFDLSFRFSCVPFSLRTRGSTDIPVAVQPL